MEGVDGAGQEVQQSVLYRLERSHETYGSCTVMGHGTLLLTGFELL